MSPKTPTAIIFRNDAQLKIVGSVQLFHNNIYSPVKQLHALLAKFDPQTSAKIFRCVASCFVAHGYYSLSVILFQGFSDNFGDQFRTLSWSNPPFLSMPW